ncbi:hypothetical protein D3C71_827860 [compost metagenome]
MNPIQKAISDVKASIPREILERTFMKPDSIAYGTRSSYSPTSLDFRIRTAVIEGNVLPDCNLVGGTEVTIPLSSVIPQLVSDYNVIYRVPKSLTQNRSILRLLHLTFGDGGVVGSQNLAIQGRSAMMDGAQGVLQAHLPIPIVSTANLELVAENTVMVKDNITMPGNPYLRCVVEGDTELNHLQPTSYKAFSKLVVLATKAYIFNNIAIPMDQAALSGGMALGRIREIVDGYSDAYEQYDTYFEEVWRKVAIFNDPEANKRHLKLITGGRW